jgi:hypothetical protein
MLSNEIHSELANLARELDQAQTMIDKKRNSPLGKLPLFRSALAESQLKLDAQRIRVAAAMKYHVATSK